MDKKRLLLLKYLLNNCDDGYKVLEIKKILSSIKKYSYQSLEKDIEYLKQMNYIDLQYMDEINICLCMKDNSRIVQENMAMENRSKRFLYLVLTLSILVSGLMSFIGAFVATLIYR